MAAEDAIELAVCGVIGTIVIVIDEELVAVAHTVFIVVAKGLGQVIYSEDATAGISSEAAGVDGCAG